MVRWNVVNEVLNEILWFGNGFLWCLCFACLFSFSVFLFKFYTLNLPLVILIVYDDFMVGFYNEDFEAFSVWFDFFYSFAGLSDSVEQYMPLYCNWYYLTSVLYDNFQVGCLLSPYIIMSNWLYNIGYFPYPLEVMPYGNFDSRIFVSFLLLWYISVAFLVIFTIIFEMYFEIDLPYEED